MRRMGLLLIFAVFVSTGACRRPARSGTLIDRYRVAACVPLGIAKGVEPPTAGWDVTVKLSDGSSVALRGIHMGPGGISVRYEQNGPEHVAVLPGDYISPSDLRIASSLDILYVKARGSAGGVWPETWLHEYDLGDRREMARLLVEPSVLPAECPMPPLPAR